MILYLVFRSTNIKLPQINTQALCNLAQFKAICSFYINGIEYRCRKTRKHGRTAIVQ